VVFGFYVRSAGVALPPQQSRRFLLKPMAQKSGPTPSRQKQIKITPHNAGHFYLCIYTTTLEPILAKIADADEPAASRRKAAACLAEKLPVPLSERIGARKNKR